jgi:hypothetical protein
MPTLLFLQAFYAMPSCSPSHTLIHFSADYRNKTFNLLYSIPPDFSDLPNPFKKVFSAFDPSHLGSSLSINSLNSYRTSYHRVLARPLKEYTILALVTGGMKQLITSHLNPTNLAKEITNGVGSYQLTGFEFSKIRGAYGSFIYISGSWIFSYSNDCDYQLSISISHLITNRTSFLIYSLTPSNDSVKRREDRHSHRYGVCRGARSLHRIIFE